MIFDRGTQPQALDLGRDVRYEAGVCTYCGGNVGGELISLWRQTYPGEVEYRCDKCHRLEPPEARAVMMRPKASKHPKPARRVCARPGCGVTFQPSKSSSPRRYCHGRCASLDRHERLYPAIHITPDVLSTYQTRNAARAKRVQEVGTTRVCLCGCKRTFVVRHIRGRQQRFYEDKCRARLYYHTVTKRRKAA